MSFLQQNITANDATFKQRVEAATVKVAKLVQGEVQSTMTLIQWQKRAELARAVLGVYAYPDGSPIWLDTFLNAVAANPTIGDTTPITETSPTDNDIEFEVTASWDDIAGVSGEDLT